MYFEIQRGIEQPMILDHFLYREVMEKIFLFLLVKIGLVYVVVNRYLSFSQQVI